MSPVTKRLLAVYAALAVLTISTAAIALINLGSMNFVIAMFIAATKSTLVALFFMHVLQGRMLIKVVAAGGLFWLLTLLLLTFNDYISRGWVVHPMLWK